MDSEAKVDPSVETSELDESETVAALEEPTAEQPQTSSKKKRKKKKKSGGSDGASDSESGSGSDSDSGSSSRSPSNKPPPELKAEIDKQFGMALVDARKGEEEIISLDKCYLKTSQLNKLIMALHGKHQKVMNLVLSNNFLSDEGCRSLATVLQDPAFCPHLLCVDLRGNPQVSSVGTTLMDDVSIIRPSLQTWSGAIIADNTLDPDESVQDVFKQFTLQEEEPIGASPADQWAVLQASLSLTGSDSCSRISEVMRDVVDAVNNELVKEVAVEGAGEGATSVVVASRQMYQPPGKYTLYAISKLHLLHPVLDLIPPPFQSTAFQHPVAGVGSHRFHASALVCRLVRTACDPSLGTELLQPLIDSQLLPKVLHLGLSHSHSSCMHGALLDAYSEETLVHMPRELWQPMLLPNFGLPDERPPNPLDALPFILLHHASTALRQTVGQRSGLVGLVINLASVFKAASETNTDIKEAFEKDSHWMELLQDGGPLSQLQDEQAGGLGGGKSAVLGQDVIVDETAGRPEDFSRVMLGIREYSAMHQSLNLAPALN